MEERFGFTWRDMLTETKLFVKDLTQILYEVPFVVQRAKVDFWYAMEHPRPGMF